MIHIYKANRGRYINPISIIGSGIKFENENGKRTSRPLKLPCEHPDHFKNNNTRKLYFNSRDMFLQKYHLTKKELNEAVKQYDMASLEMRGRFICIHCQKELNGK